MKTLKTLKKISEKSCQIMEEGDETKDFMTGFVLLDDSTIRKEGADENDPIVIIVIRTNGLREVYVRLGANKIELNENESASVWEKVYSL